jgi:hypothetical protein
MKNLKEKEKKDEFDETKETQEEELRQTFLQTSMPIHTNMPHTHKCDFTHRFFTAPTLYTPSLLRAKTVTHKHPGGIFTVRIFITKLSFRHSETSILTEKKGSPNLRV